MNVNEKDYLLQEKFFPPILTRIIEEISKRISKNRAVTLPRIRSSK